MNNHENTSGAMRDVFIFISKFHYYNDFIWETKLFILQTRKPKFQKVNGLHNMHAYWVTKPSWNPNIQNIWQYEELDKKIIFQVTKNYQSTIKYSIFLKFYFDGI